MRAYDWIERAKKAANIESDYRIAQVLGISRAAVSNYRRNKGLLDPEVAIKIAEIADIPIETVLLDQVAESVKTPSARAAMERFCILCKVERTTRKRAPNPLLAKTYGLHCVPHALS